MHYLFSPKIKKKTGWQLVITSQHGGVRQLFHLYSWGCFTTQEMS
jgi:hypothetical protein